MLLMTFIILIKARFQNTDCHMILSLILINYISSYNKLFQIVKQENVSGKICIICSAFFYWCQMTGCQMVKCQMSYCQMVKCQMTGCQIVKCQMSDCQMIKCQMTECQSALQPCTFHQFMIERSHSNVTFVTLTFRQSRA